MSDIRKELEARIAKIQSEIGVLQGRRANIDEKLVEVEKMLGALRMIYAVEVKSLGESKVPLFTSKEQPYRFIGMKLTDALAILQKEKPTITKKEAVKILEKENFNFRGSRHLSAVHFAWIALGRKKKGGK